MSEGAGGAGTLEMLQNALEAVRILRSNVGGFFENIASGAKTDASNEEKEKQFKMEIYKILENLK